MSSFVDNLSGPDRPLISVIVPVYNVEKYLVQCVESIQRQTYQALEIILVDDGSTDASGVLCDEIAKSDRRVTVIHQENMGLSGARNTALDMASGSAVTFVDSDDWLDERMVEKLAAALDGSDADVAVCGAVYCREDGEILHKSGVKAQIDLCGEEVMRVFFAKPGVIETMAWGKLYRAELFSNLRFPLGRYHEDVFIMYRLLDASRRVRVIPEALYWYRQTPQSIMRRTFDARHVDALYAVQERAGYVQSRHPALTGYARAAIPYTASTVFERMIRADVHDAEIEAKLRDAIRRNLFFFLLLSKSKLPTKLFALCAAVSMAMTRSLYSIVKKE